MYYYITKERILHYKVKAFFLGFLLPGIVTNTVVTLGGERTNREEPESPVLYCPVKIRSGEKIGEKQTQK